MKTTKVKLKKPIYFLKIVSDTYSDWRLYKTRPTRSSEQDVIYKVTQKTIVTINKDEVIDLTLQKGLAALNRSVIIDLGDISDWLTRKGINAKIDKNDCYRLNSWDSCTQKYNEEYGYKLNHDIRFERGVEALSDDYELSEITVFIDEDTEIVPFNAADNKVVNRIKDTAAKRQVFDTFIKDSIQPILEKYGMKLYGRDACFKSYKDLVSFIHEALRDKLNKEFNQLGLNISECATISNHSPSNLFVCEPMFGFENIDMIDQDSTNN